MLDALSYEVRNIPIGVSLSGASMPPVRSGAEVAAEIPGRFLVRYLNPEELTRRLSPSSDPTFVTLTAYTPEEAVAWLNLPTPPFIPRTHAMLLDPAKIDEIVGPFYAGPVSGIQFLLPHGYTTGAVKVAGTTGGPWAHVVN